MIGGTERWIQALLLSPFVRQKLRPLATLPRKEDLQFLKELIEAGQITPVIDRTLALEDAPEAFRYLKTGDTRGKVVIAVKPSAP